MTIKDTTKEREREKYLVTDAELIRRLGFIHNQGTKAFLCATDFEIAHKGQLFLGKRFCAMVTA
jgi:hypothetical protein